MGEISKRLALKLNGKDQHRDPMEQVGIEMIWEKLK